MQPHSVDIHLSPVSIPTLRMGQLSIVALRGFKVSPNGGAPIVCAQIASPMSVCTVKWDEIFSAYVYSNQIAPRVFMRTLSSCQLGLGDTADLAPSMSISVHKAGPANSISIENNSGHSACVGIGDFVNAQPTPGCAVPLNASDTAVFTPLQTVFLTVRQLAAQPGDIMEHAQTDGLLVDMGTTHNRAVSYDVNSGWSAAGAGWAKPVQAGSALAGLLLI